MFNSVSCRNNDLSVGDASSTCSGADSLANSPSTFRNKRTLLDSSPSTFRNRNLLDSSSLISYDFELSSPSTYRNRISGARSPLTDRGTDSLVSSPRSSVVNEDSSNSDAEFNSKAYVEELLQCGLKEERFRIDRRKLEEMLQIQNENGTVESAEHFFEKVMLGTSTQISWPSKLKIGAKSKKDPHVKIVGKPENVQMAKDKILQILDTKKNRVTLKMDVSHDNHSYIIGKGGFKIQQVMEETGCHIHFPDSNRNSTAEKSNQVSIAGQAKAVELARSKIRELLPMVFSFELPSNESIKPGEENSPAVQHIQQTYSFNVQFRPLGMGRTLLVVRGCQKLISRLRQGLALLLEYLTGSKSIPIMGFMKTEIAAQHHQFVAGSANSNIQAIMSKTGTTILFPEVQLVENMMMPTIIPGYSVTKSKSTVIIQGPFDGVCIAWHELLKCLPLVLAFDLREGQELDPVMVNAFMESFDVSIMVRPKLKENIKSVLLRGAERDSKVLFQIRKEILQIDEDDIHSVDQTIRALPTIEINKRRQMPNLNAPDKKTNALNMSTVESLSIISNIIQQNPQIVGLLNNLTSVFQVNNSEATPNPLHAYGNTVASPVQSRIPFYSTQNVENWIQHPSSAYSAGNDANFLNVDRYLPDETDSGISMPKFFSNGFEYKSELSQPESSASSTSSCGTPDYKASLKCETPKEATNANRLLADYNNLKLSASKALKQPIEGARTPTRIWSGLGFSKSMPDAGGKSPVHNAAVNLLESKTPSNIEAVAAKAWNTEVSEKNDSVFEQVLSPFSLSNFWENLPRQSTINYGAVKSMDQLLSLLDLDKYAEVFEHHEVDLAIFVTLTDIDLQQLGINYTARRKMLTAISAIKEQKMNDWSMKNFPAAPGAERQNCLKFSINSDDGDN